MLFPSPSGGAARPPSDAPCGHPRPPRGRAPASPATLLSAPARLFPARTLCLAALAVLALAAPAALADERLATPKQQLDELAAVISERLGLMRQVAHYKFVRKQAIRAPQREKQQLEKLGKDAELMGINPRTFAKQMQLQFDMASSVQEYWFERWEEAGPPKGKPVSLRTLRVRIDRFNQRLLRALYLAAPHLHKPPEGMPPLMDLSVVAAGHPVDPFLVLRLERALSTVGKKKEEQFWLPYSNLPAHARVRKSKVLRVGTTGDYPPFSFRDAKGKFTGIDIEMAEHLARNLGLELVLVPTSWPSLSQDMVDNRFDIAMSGVSITADRRKTVGIFSDPYHSGGKIGIGRCEDVERFRVLDGIDQPGVRVVVNPGGTNEAFARERLRFAEIKVHGDNLTIFEQLKKGAADVMVTDWMEAAMQANGSDGALCVLARKPYRRTRKGYWMQNNRDLAEDVAVFLERMARSQRLDQTYQKYVGEVWDRRRGRAQ